MKCTGHRYQVPAAYSKVRCPVCKAEVDVRLVRRDDGTSRGFPAIHDAA